jgi:chorismate mutase / prephenate dehydratase
MSATPSDLADLRHRLDAIDNHIHDLLIERAAVVARVAASKQSEDIAFYQPGREAQILRRLAARHHGALPAAVVLRIWREILAATVRIETPFAVAVFAPPGTLGFWDVARDHYGSLAPMTAYRSPGQVIGAVSEGAAAVGILPMPQQADSDPWWRHLVSHRDSIPRVAARLPFGPPGNARSDGAEALVIGHVVQQETGADRTLFAAEAAADISGGRFVEQLGSIGLACTFFASCEHNAGSLNLFEFEGFVPGGDPRIGRLRSQFDGAIGRVQPLGGYAMPLTATPARPGATKG